MKYFLYFILLVPVQLFCKSTPDSLRTIDLQHKNLSAFPANFEYARVWSLHMGYNPIKTVPQELTSAKNLKQLSINYTPQFDLEGSIGIIKQLKIEELSINNSNLLYLPLEMGEIKTLLRLSLANNYIKEIPKYVFVHANLTDLNLSGNQVATLPEEISSQSNLTLLDLSKNGCINNSSTYKNLLPLTGLKQLNVKGATTLPATLWNLKTVEVLDISDGTFEKTELPAEANKNSLQKLTAFDCNNMDFSSLLPVLSCSSLKEISLGGEKFNGFSNAQLSSALTHLNLSGTMLEHFSFSSSLSNLQELVLNFASVTCEPELIATLAKAGNLKTLNLNNCNINHLPPSFRNLKSLEILTISGNKLTSINELFPLKQLLVLDVSLCGLSKEQVEKLQKELPTTTIICNQPFDKAPLPNVIVNTESFSVTPTLNQTITTQNGTIITIPKNSLVYDNGKPVKEPVSINYTPYYNLADISASGINMNYESKDGSAPFTSAGMFKVTANVNGQNVAVKKGSEITVAFKSNDADQSYNYYAYDSINKSWTDIGKDSVTKIKVVKPMDSTTINSSTADAPPTAMPQPPLFYRFHQITIDWKLDADKKLNGKFSLTTEYPGPKTVDDTTTNDNYFTEIKAISNIKWVFDAEKSPFRIREFMKNTELFTVDIDKKPHKKPRFYRSKTNAQKLIDFDIIPDKEHDNFIFKFYDDLDTVTFNAYPEVQLRNADRAQKTIKKIFFRYQAAAKTRKALTEYRKNRFLMAYGRFKLNMTGLRRQMTKKEELEIANLVNNSLATNSYGITRVLALQGFGIYNCDRTVYIQNPIVFKPVFEDERGNKLGNISYQLIDRKENTVTSIYGDRPVKVSRNSVITFLSTTYSNNTSAVYIGKLRTFDMPVKNGSVKLQLSQVSPKLSIGDLNELILLNQ
jgi:Leucine-rich repeat (LRR) protein